MNEYCCSKKTIIISWIILIIYLSFDFILESKTKFWQLNFNWEQLRIIDKTEIEIDSISHDFLRAKTDAKQSFFNTNYTYSITDGNEKYFRSTDIHFHDMGISFSGIKWINSTSLKSTGNSTLKTVSLPLIQNGKKTLAVIGDSHIIWRHGRELRKELFEKDNNLKFLGVNLDVYGFPYSGGTYYKSAEIVEEINKIDSVENYLLFFGAHDRNTLLEILENDIKSIIVDLSQRKETEKILLITLPPSTKEEVEEYNLKFNALLKNLATETPRVKVLDLYSILSGTNNYLYKDNIHLNQRAYQMLADLIIKALE